MPGYFKLSTNLSKQTQQKDGPGYIKLCANLSKQLWQKGGPCFLLVLLPFFKITNHIRQQSDNQCC
jgi:hypothetical protein